MLSYLLDFGSCFVLILQESGEILERNILLGAIEMDGTKLLVISVLWLSKLEMENGILGII